MHAANLPDSEIKDLSIEEVKELVSVLQRLKPQKPLLSLEMAKRYLFCPFFEKRLKGMKEFQLIREQILDGLNSASPRLTAQDFSEWVLQSGVLQFIFKENIHQELIKRSISVLQILALDPATFPSDLVKMIWQCCAPDKHDDVVRATLNLVS